MQNQNQFDWVIENNSKTDSADRSLETRKVDRSRLSPESIQTLHQRALEVARSYCRVEAELLDVLIAVESNRIYLELGYSSLFIYCVESLKLSEATAYNAIGVARKAREVPELKHEIASGELSISKARKIVPVLNSSNSSDWIEKAKSLSSRKLEKEVAAVSPRAAVPEQARYVSRERLAVSLGLNEATMLQFRRAQDQVSRCKSRPVSLEETLEELLSYYLKHKDPVVKARRVIAKKGSDQGVSTDQVSEGNQAPERNQAPAVVIRHKGEGHRQLVTGRVNRTPIPASVLHQVRLRDKGRCQYRRMLDGNRSDHICGERRWVEIHHILPVSRGGQNTVSNLLTICRGHHQLIHAGASSPMSPLLSLSRS